VDRLWIEMEGLVNLRDVGDIPTTDGGTIRRGRLLRSDNLQSLTDDDIDTLIELGLTDVVDLRSDYEVASEGPGPLSDHPGVTIHQHSMFREWREGIGEDKPDARPEVLPEAALPWVDLTPSVQLDHPVASHYLSYVVDRPDSVLAALRAIGEAEGAALVHCAAGKDRTGTVVALALLVAGAERSAVVDDYAASTERMEAIVGRLMQSDTYAENLRDRPVSANNTHPETMQVFLDHIDGEYGGVTGLLERLGWTEDDDARLRAKLRD
jgi:protein-tyrosine phosphatase